MAQFLNNDNSIWLKNFDADPNTLAVLHQLPQGTRLKVIIEGVVCELEKMKDGRDGRPTQGLKAVGKSVGFLNGLQSRRGEYLDISIADPRDSYLAALQDQLSEWNSPEDELAFRDL
jgi:hypothetical protein